jgi:hypothetical protein
MIQTKPAAGPAILYILMNNMHELCIKPAGGTDAEKGSEIARKGKGEYDNIENI